MWKKKKKFSALVRLKTPLLLQPPILSQQQQAANVSACEKLRQLLKLADFSANTLSTPSTCLRYFAQTLICQSFPFCQEKKREKCCLQQNNNQINTSISCQVEPGFGSKNSKTTNILNDNRLTKLETLYLTTCLVQSYSTSTECQIPETSAIHLLSVCG